MNAPSGKFGATDSLGIAEEPGLLVLPSVTTLEAGAAQNLGRHSGTLSLPSLRALAPADAKHLGRHCDLLILDGLATLCADAARSLGRHRGGISLRGLPTLAPKAARGLAAARGDLWLTGLQTIDADVGASLAPSTGMLYLDGLKDISDDTAVALAAHQGGLSLAGLRCLSVTAARALSRHRGRLVLDGIRVMSIEVAQALAGHSGGLSLGGFEEISSEVAMALAACPGDLRLDGVRSLSAEVARALGGHQGWLSLAGVAALGEAACRALVRHREWISLTGLARMSDAVAEMLGQHGRINVRPPLAAAIAKTREQAAATKPSPESEPVIGVAIIGSGFSGLGMAIGLLGAGRQDFVIFEKAPALGGTWRDNTYPGCACDIPSHLYSYSFFPEANWSTRYASQREILAYIEKVAGKHGIDRYIRHNTAISNLEWDEKQKLWMVGTADGRRFRARVVIAAVGGIHIPHVPGIPGLETFAGPVFHTARWRHDIDLAGRRVAVVGTGASSVQVVPEMAKVADRLIVYQRTPAWVLPRNERTYSRLSKWAIGTIPGFGRLRRLCEYWAAELRAIPLILHPRLLVHGQRATDKFLKRCIKERQIRRKLIPRYTLGCKRVLTSNDYFPAIARDNVEVVMEAIAEIRPWSVLTVDGIERAIDAMVLATGFKPFNITDSMDIIGRAGATLATTWRDGPEAFRGVALAGFPNLFLMMGPNTALAHNSIIVMIEAQVRYILQCLGWLQTGRLETLEVRSDVQDRYNERLRRRFERTVWASRRHSPDRGRAIVPCATWYRHPSGRNHVLWPGSSVSYCAAMRRADIREFVQSADCGGNPVESCSTVQKTAA